MQDLLHHFDTLKNKFGQFIPRKKQSTVLLQHPALTKKLTTLENRLQGAIQFLRNTRILKNGAALKLHHLPWYLILGSTGTGKTTLLASSTINFILEKNFNHDVAAMQASESCDWWVTQDTVFIDVPGHYVAAKNKKNALSHNLWENFLILLHRYRGKKAINGIIVAISLEDLIQATKRDALLRRLNARFNEIKMHLGITLPIFISITKCDLIPGFLEFFNDSSNEELNQAWGITLASNESIISNFSQRFNILIKRLNEQLIWRLHQEHNPYAKVLIKDFPLQIERVKEALIEVLKIFPQAKDIFNVKGIFLTSGIQSNDVQSENQPYPAILPSQELTQSFEILRAPEVQNQSYFIKQFLLHGLTKSLHLPSFITSKRRLATIYGAILGSALISISFFGNYLYHRHSLSNITQIDAKEITNASLALTSPHLNTQAHYSPINNTILQRG